MCYFFHRTWLATAVISCLCVASAQLARGDTTLDLIYDAETGSLTTMPTAQDLKINSRQGWFTQFPTIGVEDLYDHFLRVVRPPSEQPLEIGPVLQPNLTLTDLLQDLCVTAVQHGQLDWMPQHLFDQIRLNGQVLHSEPATCERIPREFPPFTGEHSAILQYDASTGGLRLRSQTPLTTLQMVSQQGIFTGTPNEGVFLGFWDVARPDKLFKLWPGGFVEVDYGPVVQPGLSNHEILADICAVGSWLGGGRAELDYAYPGAEAVPIRACPIGGFEPPPSEAGVTLQYDAASGELTIDATDLAAAPVPAGAAAAGEPLLMTTLELRSQSGIFTGDSPASLNGPSDRHTPFRILRQDREGFASVDLGAALTPGLSADFVLQDVTLDASFLDGNAIGDVRVVTVPEPAGYTGALMALLLAALAMRR